MRFCYRVIVLLAVVSYGTTATLPAGDDVAREELDSPPGTGTIMGQITYRRDPARPWRLGRYYVRRAKTGALREAVVAISDRGLKPRDVAHESKMFTVDQHDYEFTPETTAIRVGDRVKFLNHDHQIHNVRSAHPRQSFNINMPSGAEHVETFAFASGTRQPYRIGCVYHSAMRAWVFVFDHPWFQLTGDDGSFRLVGVPPGEHRLEVVHAAGELRQSRTVMVEADQTVSLEIELNPDDRVGQAERSTN
jgi:plastocyanin